MDAENEEVGISEEYIAAAESLAAVARAFAKRGWATADCAALSLVVREEPFCLAITPRDSRQRSLSARDICFTDSWGNVIGSTAHEPSADLPLHREILRITGMKAIVRTHSLWSLLAAELFLPQGGAAFEGYDCLGGLSGARDREHREWVPTANRAAEIEEQLELLREVIRQNPAAHGLLVPGLGLYCWGCRIEEAKRNAEILEFLFEVRGRFYSSSSSVRPVFQRGEAWRSGQWSLGRSADAQSEGETKEEPLPALRLVQGSGS